MVPLVSQATLLPTELLRPIDILLFNFFCEVCLHVTIVEISCDSFHYEYLF